MGIAEEEVGRPEDDSEEDLDFAEARGRSPEDVVWRSSSALSTAYRRNTSSLTYHGLVYGVLVYCTYATSFTTLCCSESVKSSS